MNMKRKAVRIKTTTKADPQNREGRIALAKMIMRLFDLWELGVQDQLSLLGLSKNSMATLRRYRNGSPLANSNDLLDRVANLLSIHQSLRLLFPHNRALAYKWPTTVNRAFGERSPVEVIIRSLESMRQLKILNLIMAFNTGVFC
jgi:hypothetical protein